MGEQSAGELRGIPGHCGHRTGLSGNPDIAFKLSQGPPPINFNIQPDGSAPFIGTNYSGRTASYYDPAMRSPYVMNWNAGVQRQFGRDYLLEFTYQGSSGVGLLNRWDINAIPLNISNDPVAVGNHPPARRRTSDRIRSLGACCITATTGTAASIPAR